MNKSKALKIFAIILVLINIGLISFLLMHHPRPPHGEGPKREIIARLGFSPDQIKAYEGLIDWHRSEIDKSDRKIMELKNELYQTFDKPGDRAKDSLMGAIAAEQHHIEETHYKHFQDIEKLCVGAQKQEFQALTHDLAEYFHPGKDKPERHP